MITYKTKIKKTIDVILDGKKVGVIVEAQFNKNNQPIGWQYCPRGKKKLGGKIYPSIDEVQRNIEGE